MWLLQYGRYVIPFVGILVAGTLAVCIMYPDPRKVPDGTNLADMKLNPFEAAYAVFTLIFFQPDLVEFDKAPLLLQIIFFAVPVAGLFIIAPGVLRFGEALLDHRKRRETSPRAEPAIATRSRSKLSLKSRTICSIPALIREITVREIRS